MKRFASVLALLIAATGCDKAPEPGAQASATPAAKDSASSSARTIDVEVGDKGFEPNNVEVKKGENVTLRFKRTSEETCAKDVVFPELDIKKPLPLNKAVDIKVPTSKARTLSFQCGMGMFKSAVLVK